MKFVIITIFPEFFPGPLGVGLLGKALENDIVSVETVQLRDFTSDRHRSVDDEPYGGGPGMVMLVQPLVDALDKCRSEQQVDRTILLSPRGPRFDQEAARRLAGYGTVCLVCGRYEGVDERLVEGGFVDEELSLGDFVLNGGEVAALAVIEASSRMLPGVVGNEDSVIADSFYDGLLDFPHYTRPRVFRGLEAPKVLLSGNHALVDRWRRRQALKATAQRRPDLLTNRELPAADRKLLEED